MASVALTLSANRTILHLEAPSSQSASKAKPNATRTCNSSPIFKNKNLRLVVKCNSSGGSESNTQELQRKGDSDKQENAKEEKLEAGWKRTKPIVFERSKGAAILAVLTRFGDVMDHPFGSVTTLAKVGGIVAEKVKEETDVLRNQDDIQEVKLNELIRVVKLMEMDLKFAGAARKEETLSERIDQARAHCRQAIFIANAL